MGLFEHFPYTNFHSLNIEWAIEKIKELLQQGEALYSQLQQWKTDTDTELTAWKMQTLADLTTWEDNFSQAVEKWKTATVEQFESEFTQYETSFNAIQTAAEAAMGAAQTAAGNAENSATAAAQSATAAAQSAAQVPGLRSAIAPVFDSTTSYAEGAAVFYNNALYQFTKEHPAGEWTGTDAVPFAMDNFVSDVLRKVEDFSTPNDITRVWTQGNISSTGGNNTTVNQEYRIRLYSHLHSYGAIHIVIPEGMRLFVYRYTGTTVSSFIPNSPYGWQTGEVWLFEDLYYRFVLSYVDESMPITPDAGALLTITQYMPTDKTLTSANKAADAEAVGNALAGKADGETVETLASNIDKKYGYVRLLTSADDLDAISDGGVYRWTGSSVPLNSPTSTAAILFIFGSSEYYTQLIINFPANIYTRYHNGTSGFPYDWTGFVASRIATPSSVAISISNDKPLSWGLSNAMARAAQICDTRWTSVGDMPRTLSTAVYPSPVSYFARGTHTGMPYSSVRDQDKAIGMDVSIHTFITAAHDPNSVLYTRRSTVSNSSTYYGTVCSGLLNYSMGYQLDLTNYFLSEWADYETIPMQSIMPGDMIWISGHCALVHDVTKDDYGRIKGVTIWEEWRPLPRKVTYDSWNAFITERAGYIARRYKYIAGIDYTPIPYIALFDESASEVVFPAAQTDHGDAAVFMIGEDVRINIVDSTNVTRIDVLNSGGTVVHATTTIEPFTLEGLAGGLYTVRAYRESGNSDSTFFIVDATAAFNSETGALSFSSTNATPVLANVYSLPSDRAVSCLPYILTDEDRNAGSVDLSSLMTSEYNNAKISFMTPYGTAVWYSETHTKWVAIP